MNQVSTQPVTVAPSPNDHMLLRVPHRHEVMSVAAFSALPPHRRQRDTEGRLARALQKQFASASPTHQVVAAVEFQGVMYKLDGHTRNLAWSLGKLLQPAQLSVHIYTCATLEDYLEIYSHFDSIYSAEGNFDKLRGALRASGIAIQSGLLDCDWTSALKLASRSLGAEMKDPYSMTDEFSDEIAALDALNLPSKSISRGGQAAYLILCRRYGATTPNSVVDDFFTKVAARTGSRNGSEIDGIEYVRLMESMGVTGRGRQINMQKCEWVLMAFEKYRLKQMMTATKNPVYADDDKDHNNIPWFAKGVKPVAVEDFNKGKRKLTV